MTVEETISSLVSRVQTTTGESQLKAATELRYYLADDVARELVDFDYALQRTDLMHIAMSASGELADLLASSFRECIGWASDELVYEKMSQLFEAVRAGSAQAITMASGAVGDYLCHLMEGDWPDELIGFHNDANPAVRNSICGGLFFAPAEFHSFHCDKISAIFREHLDDSHFAIQILAATWMLRLRLPEYEDRAMGLLHKGLAPEADPEIRTLAQVVFVLTVDMKEEQDSALSLLNAALDSNSTPDVRASAKEKFLALVKEIKVLEDGGEDEEDEHYDEADDEDYDEDDEDDEDEKDDEDEQC